MRVVWAGGSLPAWKIIRELQAAGCGDVAIIVVTGRQMDRQGVELICVDLCGYRIHIDGALVMIDVDLAIVDPSDLEVLALQPDAGAHLAREPLAALDGRPPPHRAQHGCGVGNGAGAGWGRRLGGAARSHCLLRPVVGRLARQRLPGVRAPNHKIHHLAPPGRSFAAGLGGYWSRAARKHRRSDWLLSFA